MIKMKVFFCFRSFFCFFCFFKPIPQSDSFRGDHPRPCLRGSQHSQNTPVANAKNKFVQFPLSKLSFCYGPCILFTRNDLLQKYLNHGLLEHFHEIKRLSVLLKTVISSLLLLLLLTISLFTKISITVSRQLVPIILMRNITCYGILMYGGRCTYNFEKRLFLYKLCSSFIIPPVCPFAVSFVAEYWETLE